LVDNDRIGLTGVIDGIDRAFGCSVDSRNTHIDRIRTVVHSLGEHPLSAARWRRGPSAHKAHDSTLGTACGDIGPAFRRSLDKPSRTIINDDPGCRDGRKCQCGPGWIDLRSVIHEVWIGDP
jgi:hypothetical protein